MRRLRKISICLMIVFLMTCLSGCTYLDSLKMLEPFSEEEEIYTFYGEGKSRSFIDGEVVQDFSFKEWKGSGKKYRSEITGTIDREFYKQYYDENPSPEQIEGDKILMKEKDIFNEQQLIVYLPYKDEYSIKEISLADDVSPIVLLGINEVLNAGGLKDYATAVINELAQSYILEIEDNIKVNGRQTQHITATSKSLGDKEIQEVWIDPNNWMVVKERIQNGNYTEEFEYIDFKFNPKIDERLFEMKIPQNADVVYLDENLAAINEEITLEEAPDRLGRPVFYLADDKAELTSCRYIESITWKDGRIELIYRLSDDREIIVESSPVDENYETIQLGYEKIRVRSQEAVYKESGELKFIEFKQNQTLCEIYVKNSKISKNELIQLANQLEQKK